MDGISKEQEEVLSKIERKRYPPELTISRIVDFLREKPDEEPLKPEWLEVWDRYRSVAEERDVPPKVIEEIENQIESISRIDEEISSIDIDNNTKVTFLLGAGASAPSNIPTVGNLLPELWDRAKKIGREDLDNLARWCQDRDIDNIEDLLTAAYISDFVATNHGITSLLDYFLFSGGRERTRRERYFSQSQSARTAEVDVSSISFLQDTLQTLFGLLTSTMISASPNPTHEAIVDFVEEHENSFIITTNYDGCMDEAILENNMRLKGTIDDSNIRENHSDAVQLTKMHGSINWAYCDSCQDAQEFDLLELKEIYEKDKLSYPVMGICKNCGGLRRPLLVPPLSFKFLMFPNLINMWNSARKSIEKADYLIIVGYSFSEADTYITKIISRSMSRKGNQKMLLINTDPNLAPTLRDRFSAHIDGFNRKRVLSAVESSEKILPDILQSMLGEEEAGDLGELVSKEV